MAQTRLKMLPISLLSLLGLMVLGTTASEEPPSTSPTAEVELICHTTDPAECYPKIFQPTHEFQIVHPDQDLPLGLHVRLDINTGQKEAKINIPDEEVDPSLVGLPIDSSIVTVDTPDSESEPAQRPRKLPKNAPKYDPDGKVKEPPKSNPHAGNDAAAFFESLTYLKKGLDIDSALESLSDVSHDIYYGLKIAEDYDTIANLFCLANTPALFTASPSPETLSRARVAALTLSSVTQNNPKALSEIETHWPKLLASSCSDEPLSALIWRLIPSSGQPDPAVSKARISSISGLLKSSKIRSHFLSNNGMEQILQIMNLQDQNNGDFEPAARKAAILVLDNFLDGDMGASLGEWPIGTQQTDVVCEGRHKEGKEPVERCWDWHARLWVKGNKKNKEHWSHELLKKVTEQRRVNNKGGKKKNAAQGGKEEL
ncbi:Putative nucleotide exchange factor SIL1 precursor [Podospora comata]|uniref:Nucleotide exchange factor SIL1 n=1 Tax=Podospora comata TaxID=48703 RepID=A0ABY6RY17_PODCO|nr:Putative nucleotide exchange factor SIL1 precursor [Podospora comata]